MSQTEIMEKEFTEAELAGGESLIDDEDLTDEEYVEALGEHDAEGNVILSDKPKKIKSPAISPVHQKNKQDSVVKDEVKTEKDTEKQVDGFCEDSVNSDVMPSSPAGTTTPIGLHAGGKEAKSEIESVDKTKDDKDTTTVSADVVSNKQTDDNVFDEARVQHSDGEDVDDKGEIEDGEIEREVDEEDEGDGESIEDGQADADDQENTEISKQSNKELDDDEDRRNPQYIPKRGAFYEHDDRLGTDEEEEDEEKEAEKAEVTVEKKPENPVVEVRKPKKLWSDDTKWGHDMFDDEEQQPKARDEIVSTYGYDIRSEDGPPKARRRRRYGRGPNRYTRSWKDESAYSKPNEAPAREKVISETTEIKKRETETNKPFTNKDDGDKISENIPRKSGLRGQQQKKLQPQQQQQQQQSQRRTDYKSVAMEGNDRKRSQHREREMRDDRHQRDNDRNRDRRRNGSNNRSPGSSKDLREFINSKNDRLGGDARRDPKDLFENDFPELPHNSKDRFARPSQQSQPSHHQSGPVGDMGQPNAWSKSRPKHAENIRGVESSLEYKSEPLRVPESFDKHRSYNLNETNPKIEIVKTQTFENSRYFNRRPITKNSGHHPEPSNNGSNINIKKDLSAYRNNRGRTKPIGERDFRNSGEMGRPITKTSHLVDDYEDLAGGASMEHQRRNRYNVNKEREYRGNHHDDRDRRGPDQDQRGGRSYLDDRPYESQFNDNNQSDLSSGLNKLTLVDKINNRLSSSEVNDSNKPKRYSSLRQHQAQQQQQQQQQQQPSLQQQQSEPLSQHQQLKQSQTTPNQQQSTRDTHQANSNFTQYPSTSQHLNLNHPRQSTNVQYYEAASGVNQQPPPPPSASYYIDNRSPQSSFGYIPTTNIESGPNATRFLSQIAPRFIPPPTAPPPTAPEPRFMAQAVAAVAANPAAAGAGTLPPVISGPPAATYLPTYPPGYPQYPPPPPPTAAAFSIAPPPPPPPSSATELYRGGVTYYDTMTQQVSPRQLPQRRPKNALPIVPPPDLSNNPDGMVAGVNQGYEVDENDLNQNVETITC